MNYGNNFMVICVVGQPGSGKDTLASFLVKEINFFSHFHGWYYPWRNVAEVEFFKKRFGENFVLVDVYAPMEVRYERVKKGRSREGDNISLDEFKKQEEAECNSGTHEMNKLL